MTQPVQDKIWLTQEALDKLQAELDTLSDQQNTSEDGTSIPATFLRVTVER